MFLKRHLNITIEVLALDILFAHNSLISECATVSHSTSRMMSLYKDKETIVLKRHLNGTIEVLALDHYL